MKQGERDTLDNRRGGALFPRRPSSSSSFSELCIDGKKGKKEKSDTLGSFVERIYREDASPSRIRLG